MSVPTGSGRAVISRTKLEQRHGKFAWTWLYRVSLDGAPSVEIGTRLDSAVNWARNHGATFIVKRWGHAITQEVQP